MAASVPPSVIGGTLMRNTESFYTTLETHQEGGEEGGDETGGGETSETTTSEPPTIDEEANPQTTEEYPLTRAPLELSDQEDGQGVDTTPLLHPSHRSYNDIPGLEEPRHMKRLGCMCSIVYWVAIFLVVVLVALSIVFYPKKPVYNVCSDAVAWKKIMANIIAFKLDASFEILVSVSNPNHLGVSLVKGKGSFTFDGNPVGTYEIPSEMVDPMAITDLMLIARVTPNKEQAVKMAEAYTRGKLVLSAEFQAALRVPALFDTTFNFDLKDIPVYVNELGDRSLCQCPSWDEGPSDIWRN